MRPLTRTDKVLLAVSVLMGAVFLVVVGPWIVVGIALQMDENAKARERERYLPTRLVDAVQWDRATPEMVAAMLDRGEKADQQVPAAGGRTVPLVQLAAASGNPEVVRLLIHRGARVEQAGLWEVVSHGHEPMARMLIAEGAPLGPQADFDAAVGPELIQAAAFGHQAWAVRLLLEKGADVRAVNAQGEGLLGLSLETESMDPGPHSNSLETTRALLAAGADANALDANHWSPLHWAARNDKREEAELLLARGAAVDGPPGSRVTPLAVAVARCLPEMTALLLGHGAARSVRTEEGRSLREGACYYGYPEINAPSRKKIEKLLLS